MLKEWLQQTQPHSKLNVILVFFVFCADAANNSGAGTENNSSAESNTSAENNAGAAEKNYK